VPTVFELLENEQENILKVKRDFQNICKLIESINIVYSQFYKNSSQFNLDSKYHISQLLLFSNCYTNLSQGFATLFRGHLKNSLFYIRVLSETIQNSIFLLNNKHEGENWVSNDKNIHKKYKQAYKKWFSSEGKQIIAERSPKLIEMYNLCSDIIHPNFMGQEEQFKIIEEAGSFQFRINFQDIEPSANGMFNLQLAIRYHLIIHRESIIWWEHRILEEGGILNDHTNTRQVLAKIESYISKNNLC